MAAMTEQQVVNTLTNGTYQAYQYVWEQGGSYASVGKLLWSYRNYVTAPRPLPAQGALDAARGIILSLVPSAAVTPITEELTRLDTARGQVTAALASLASGTNGYAAARTTLEGVGYMAANQDANLQELIELSKSASGFNYNPFLAMHAAARHKLYANAQQIIVYATDLNGMAGLSGSRVIEVVDFAKAAGLNETAWVEAKNDFDAILAAESVDSVAKGRYFMLLESAHTLTNINGHARYFYEGVAHKFALPGDVSKNEQRILAKAKQMEIAARRAANLPVTGPGNLPKTEAAVAAYNNGTNLVTALAELGLTLPADYADRVTEAQALAASILSEGREANPHELAFMQFFLGAVNYKTFVDAYNR
jgi:hypothetical protein